MRLCVSFPPGAVVDGVVPRSYRTPVNSTIFAGPLPATTDLGTLGFALGLNVSSIPMMASLLQIGKP
ncbi:hypothetical protein DVH29_00635 [Pelagibacterium lacus]|uniref:Uncharacterized protein n=1 Tax=Pelagibacterium lacus TaxID=2282655 RepID=A0A369WB11_9HYPH|nr:hypothetical protein DVH29_00635 [Pelagibacterium lacus]